MIGKIPKHWRIKKLGDVLEIFPTASYSRSELSDEGEVQYIHYGDIHTKFDSLLEITDDTLPKISKSKGEKYETIQLGDLVMVDASEDYQGVGKSTEIIALSRYNTIAGLHTFLLRDKGEYFYLGYKGYITMSDYVKKQLYIAATGTKVYSLSKESLKLIQLPIPPLKEQERITKILLTCDKAIRLTTQIITQLKQRNQGLAQQLLMGEKRIKGFENSVWKEVKLGEIGFFFKGKGVFKNKIIDKGFKCLTYGDLYTKYDFVIKDVKSFIDKETTLISQEIRYGDICFAGSGETLEDIGKCATFIDDEIGYAGGDIIVFRTKQNPITMSYLLNSDIVKKQKTNMGQGHSVVHIYSSQLEKLEVSLPSIAEQNAIAQILDTAHQELKLYEQKLQLLQAQKKTLMQKLLTGEVLTVK